MLVVEPSAFGTILKPNFQRPLFAPSPYRHLTMAHTIYCHICRAHHFPDEPSHESALVAGGFGGDHQVSTHIPGRHVLLVVSEAEASQLLEALVYLEHEHGTLGEPLGRVKLMLSDELGD